MELDPQQPLQVHPGGIAINELLTDREEVQIQDDKNSSHHHLSHVPDFGGGVFTPSYHSQLSDYQADCPHNQLDAQSGIPLTGPSNEAIIHVGVPGCIVGNIANANLNLKVKRQGIIDELSRSPYFNLNKMFRKLAREKVASLKAQVASEKRRTDIAKFKCPVEGCNSSFTRRHNLTSGLISMHQ